MFISKPFRTLRPARTTRVARQLKRIATTASALHPLVYVILGSVAAGVTFDVMSTLWKKNRSKDSDLE